MDSVRSIVQSRDGALWVAAGSGIHRRKGDAWFINGESDGLPSDTAYVVFEDSRGRLWAGTSRGLSRYDTAVDHDSPRAFLTKNNAAETLPDGNVTLVFSGIDRWKRTAQDRLLFGYRLDGARWSDFGSATAATFRGLNRGFHQLEVRAMDRNGNMSRPTGFRFRVAPPWYLQAGFLVSAAFALAAIVTLLSFAVHQYRQLVRAKQTAESANRLKSEFLANMSHEIRTPMNAIIGMTELAAEIATDQEQKGYLDTVRTSSQSLLALLNDVLDLSKVESGKFDLACQDFDFRLCIENAIGTLQGRADDKNLGLRFEVSPEIPDFLYGDDLRLRQVLLNLLGNAIKFTEKGEVVLRAVPEPESADKLLLRFTVADTGAGVPAEKQEVIFGAFEQADASTTRNYGGTGLGLAISTKLVSLMQGIIWVESPWRDTKTGKTVAGSAFHFTAHFDPGRKPVPNFCQISTRPGKPLRVLIAEDNAVNQLLAVRLVERMGHSVCVAGTGQQAVEVYERESPDVVLMDVQMPVMDGFEATVAIRAREAATGRRTRIIALTAHALQGYREKCLRAGMDSYVTKPIRRDDLVRAIEEALPKTPTPIG
jgi:signal transduction histidine kinase/CheY-like chemotaxis protein